MAGVLRPEPRGARQLRLPGRHLVPDGDLLHRRVRGRQSRDRPRQDRRHVLPLQ